MKESLTFNEATKKIEFEAEGRLHKFSIYDALELVDKTDWEASLPNKLTSTEKTEKIDEDEALATPKTPAGSRVNWKKKKASKVSKPNASGPGSDKDGLELTEKRPLKLPEAQYRVIGNMHILWTCHSIIDSNYLPTDDYDIPDAPPMPASYYRFIEKPAEEQDEEVEYDMDEEDVAWLDIINEKRESENLQRIEEAQFELLMDRLEKESYFHVQTNGKDFNIPIDDDAICCVCMDGECSNTNVILFCDLCNLAVHQECYGVPYIPEGQWLCRRCLQSPSRSVECCLCPNKGGAFKQTDDGRWAHVVCGLWIPEVRFANTVFLEPIDSIDNIPPARWKLGCRVCKQRGVGACIQCHKTNCYTAFHVTCGLLAGLHMKMDTVRESSASGLSVTVRKTAFCDVHTPHDSDCKPKLDDVAALGISTPKQKARSPKKMQETSPVPVLFRGLMNFSPQCPWEKVQEIASLITVQKKNQFFQRLMAYWTLKRQTRNGVPLIRRLQFAKAMRPDKAPETPQKNAHHSTTKKDGPKSVARKAKDEFKAMLDQRKTLRRLRQDLERVRLLCELIRKREQRKRELIVNHSETIALTCFPFLTFLKQVMDTLQAIDTQDIFAEPVSLDDVPDYLDHISKPMDFQTMRKKLDNFEYQTIDQMEDDFNVMVENCLSYNERDTIFFRAGVKMRDQGGSIMRHSKRLIESIGFDLETGLHSASRATHKENPVSDDKLMKEIDSFLNSEAREEMSDDMHLKKLLELQDKAMFLHHPVAKVKRQKLLKQEIIKTRRKLSMDKSRSTPGGSKAKKDAGATPQSKKKSKGREVSPLEVEDEEETTTGRRLRAGKESDKSTPASKRGNKRKRATSNDCEPPTSKKRAAEEVVLKTPVKAGMKTPVKAGASASPAKSPAGVNRRNAVLFTRKKQAASASAPSASDAKEDAKSSKRGQPEDADVSMPSPKSPSNPASPRNPVSPKKGKKKRGRKPKGAGPEIIDDDPPSPEREKGWKANAPSFQQYRRGGEVVGETDEDTQSESATDALITSEDDSETDSDDSSIDPSTASKIPLEPLDLVWAKCRGYPWYPALIINPKMPRTGYLHNGVPIPVPPEEVLDMANTHASPHYLILFFDAKRTWQWLTRDKLEPLGVDSELDKAKLVQSKKPSERKAVKKAYEDAILHRCRVTGENANLSGDTSDDNDDDESADQD